MKDEVLTVVLPSVNGSEPRIVRFEDGEPKDKGTYMEVLRRAEIQRDELLEAAKELLIELKEGHGISEGNLVGASTRRALEDMSAAIAKAEGGE